MINIETEQFDFVFGREKGVENTQNKSYKTAGDDTVGATKFFHLQFMCILTADNFS